jgi:RNA polymerase sigma factor (sigma-70 family)
LPTDQGKCTHFPYSDGELLAACADGETWAWDGLVERYKRLVYSIPLRVGLSEEDAADVFQTVFTLLVKQLRKIREPQALAKWLITTTKRESWSVCRKRSREPVDSDNLATFASPDEEEHPDSRPGEGFWIDQALIQDALAQLGDRCQELLKLLYYDPNEPSYEEISGRLGLPLGSIGPNRARCLEKMRALLKAMGMR